MKDSADENFQGHSASLQLCSWLITPATTTPAAPFFLASAQPGGHRAGSLGAVGRSTRVCDGAGQRCRTGLATFRRGGSWLSAGRRRHTTPIQRWFGLAGEQRPQGATARGCAGHPRRSAWLCRCWYVSGSWPSAQYSLSSAASSGGLCMVRRRAVQESSLTGTSAEQTPAWPAARLGAGSTGWWRIVAGWGRAPRGSAAQGSGSD